MPFEVTAVSKLVKSDDSLSLDSKFTEVLCSFSKLLH